MASAKTLPWLKPAVLVGGTWPALLTSVLALTDRLGANPIEVVLNRAGLLALIFLIASLACSPVKALLGWTWPMRIRRMLGLFAFFYALAHFVVYLALDRVFDVAAVAEDIAERPFILVGFLALVLLVPLAVTSTDRWVRRLGYARWRRLHRLAYAAGVLAAVHFIWRVKQDVTEPAIYASILAMLLLTRLVLAAVRFAQRRSRGRGAQWQSQEK